MDDNGGIGLRGHLPWPPNKEDMQFFKYTTLYCPIIMGRKTWENFGHLGKRLNVVLSRTMPQVDMADHWVVRTVDEALLIAESDYRVAYVIGGAETYSMFAPHASELLLTHIPGEHKADTFMPQSVLDEFPVIEDMSVSSLIIEKRVRYAVPPSVLRLAEPAAR